MKLYFKYLGILLKSQMQYKVSFFMTAFGHALLAFTDLVAIYFLFDRFHTVNGFSLSEILLCYSVIMVSFSFSECFVRGFDAFQRLVRSGGLDRILIRPRSVIFQVLTSNMDFSRLFKMIPAVAVLAYAVSHSGIDWTAEKIALYVFMTAGGVAFFSSMFMIYAGVSFFTVEGIEFMNIFTDGAKQFGRYPVSVYGERVLKLCTFVIPVALFQYYPFLYLTGKSDVSWYAALPALEIAFIGIAYAFFRFGLSKYLSTGS